MRQRGASTEGPRRFEHHGRPARVIRRCSTGSYAVIVSHEQHGEAAWPRSRDASENVPHMSHHLVARADSGGFLNLR